MQIKLGITLILFLTSKSSLVSFLRLSDTAVTIFDLFIEKLITGSKDGSFPTKVISVPCKVVINGILIF